MNTEAKIKTITIRLDEATHKDLKRIVIDKNTTIQNFIVNLVKKETSQK